VRTELSHSSRVSSLRGLQSPPGARRALRLLFLAVRTCIITKGSDPDCVLPGIQSLFLSLFFFSSRRRHTRFSRDWSSDVCSSDLAGLMMQYQNARLSLDSIGNYMNMPVERPADKSFVPRPFLEGGIEFRNVSFAYPEIGRASCRESVEAQLRRRCMRDKERGVAQE